MRKKKEAQAAPAAPERPIKKPTKAQRRTHILLLCAVLLFIVGIWVVRLPKYYVNLFINHYDGSTSVVTEMKGIERSDEEEALLLPLQQAFDDWKQTHLRDEVEVTSEDGYQLQGGLYDVGGEVTVILLHTFDGSSTDSDYLFAPYYADKGYNILLPDSRDNGDSEGTSVTYGLKEGADLVQWIRLLQERYGADHKVILHGDTLGANAALAAAGYNEAEGLNIRLVVAESPIINLYDGAKYLMHEQFSIPAFMVSMGSLFAQSSLDGLAMKQVDLEEMTQGCTVPLVVLQGTNDTIVDPTSVAAFVDSYAGPVEQVSVYCAHGMVYATNQQGCESTLDQMIAAYLQ